MYNLAVCRIAVKTGAPLADVRSAFLEKKDCLSLICEDGIHPNENGHKVIYQAVQEALSGQNPSA
jgi:lysophospholipase L1-like esterase